MKCIGAEFGCSKRVRCLFNCAPVCEQVSGRFVCVFECIIL